MNKIVKKQFHLYSALGIIGLLLALIYISAGNDFSSLPVIEDCPVAGAGEVAEEREQINFRALLQIEATISEELTLRLEAGKQNKEPVESSKDNEDDGKPEPESPTAQSAGETGGETAIQQAASTDSGSTGQQSISGSSLNQKEQQMVGMINEARKNAGLPALQVSSKLTDAARAKSKDMVNYSYFSHQSPTYGDLAGLLSRFGISYRAAGENLAMNSNGSVSAAHNSLMNSSGHRANILNSRFSQVGVGIHTCSDGSHYYTQIYVGR